MRKLVFVLTILLFLLSSCSTATVDNEESALRLHFFDGKTENWGDATFIAFPNGETMLIDCGVSSVGPMIVKDLQGRGITKIDHLVISHFHSDHIGGLQSILNNFTVGHIYSNGYYTTDTSWAHYAANAYDAPYTILHAGDSFDIGDVRFDVLWPTEDYTAVLPDGDSKALSGKGSTVDMNCSSLVMKMTYRENTVLFTGDLYTEGQQMVMDRFQDNIDILDCDILKVPHHGYNNANLPAFFMAVSPSYAFQMGTMVMAGGLFMNYLNAGCFPYMSWQNGNAYVTLDGTDDGIMVEVDNPQRNAYFQKYYDAYMKLQDQKSSKENTI